MSPLAFWWNLRLWYVCAICGDTHSERHSQFTCFYQNRNKNTSNAFEIAPKCELFMKIDASISIELRMSLGFINRFYFSVHYCCWSHFHSNSRRKKNCKLLRKTMTFIYAKCMFCVWKTSRVTWLFRAQCSSFPFLSLFIESIPLMQIVVIQINLHRCLHLWNEWIVSMFMIYRTGYIQYTWFW